MYRGRKRKPETVPTGGSATHALRDRARQLCNITRKTIEDAAELAAIAKEVGIDPVGNVDQICDSLSDFFTRPSGTRGRKSVKTSNRPVTGDSRGILHDTTPDVTEYEPGGCSRPPLSQELIFATGQPQPEGSVDDIVWGCACLRITYRFGIYPTRNLTNQKMDMPVPTIAVTKYYSSRKGYFTVKDVLTAAEVYYSKPITEVERNLLLAATRDILEEQQATWQWGESSESTDVPRYITDEDIRNYLGAQTFGSLITDGSKKRFSSNIQVTNDADGVTVNAY